MRAPTRESERARIEMSMRVYELSPELRASLTEAMDSDAWDWFADCDGCTTVSELHWPTKYFPPCLRHDYDCIRGKANLEASKRFYALQRSYGVPIWRAGLRATAVTVYWYAWARWQR